MSFRNNNIKINNYEENRRRRQRRRITMQKKDYEELERKETDSHRSSGFETIGDRVRQRREASENRLINDFLRERETGRLDLEKYRQRREEAIASLERKRRNTRTIGEYGTTSIIGGTADNRVVSGASAGTTSLIEDPQLDPSFVPPQNAPSDPSQETPYAPPIIAQPADDTLSDAEVQAILEEILNEEEYVTLDFLTLDRIEPTENELHLIRLARENNTDEEIEFSIIRRRDFGLEYTAQVWGGMLGETYRISQLIKQHDLIPLVEFVFGGRQRRFIINLENVEPQEFINRCVGFNVGIEEFWRRYDDEESELNIPPGKIVKEIIISIVKPPQRERIEGALFNYFLTEHWAPLKNILRRYQIYLKEEITNVENCFINSLHESGLLTKNELAQIKTKLKGNSITKKTIDIIAKEYKLNIILRYYNKSKSVINNINYGERTINLFLIRWKNNFHYVIDEKVPITSYFIKHYDEIINYCNEKGKDLEKYFNVVKKEKNEYKHSLTKFITINKCLELLKEQGAIEEITRDYMIKKKYYDSFLFTPENINLVFDESKLIEEPKKKEGESTILFADFECFTNSDYHKPFCIIVMDVNGIWKKFYGINCASKFIEYIQTIKSPLCYFHNLGYDGRFLAKYGINNIIEKGKMIYKMTIEINGKKIVFKDTLALIPTSISKFKQFFKLEGDYEKEIFPYNYYNEETMQIGVINNCWNKEVPHWSSDMIYQFKENINKTHCKIDDNHFNTEKYCEYYCLRDVMVLREGFLK
ncbi:hypothetical protein, conserved [Entamoeba dispar SAW760]|uniref:DNA-directed DNA polymerase n=1 Tax=Entamoeba dispar (strain ATCC PRA-260 / SAW760) TaxID=370354 RepID=B0EPN8_ENTDS|nr:uncharacterized protein EDI_069450 [Entamoeba dispar SAW760]EDR23508.1 hypothetical protein, conserved [Entamoeba dispar SAW760]|eukprot:EDR23508.1 hypothetical protein, conserved [Entamoeba dispar SAW760]